MRSISTAEKTKRRRGDPVPPTRNLIKAWEEGVPDAELQLIKARAKEAGLSLAEYVQAEIDGKPTMKAVPFVQFARAVSTETVGAECAAFLKRPDVLRLVKRPYPVVVAVLKHLAETNPTVAEIDDADFAVLKSVRNTWEAFHNKTRRRGVVLSR